MKLDFLEQKKAMGQLRKKRDAYRITRQWHFDYNYSLCTIMDKKRPKVSTFAFVGLFSAWNTIFGVQSKYLHKWYVLVWQINNVLERAILSFLFVTNPPL